MSVDILSGLMLAPNESDFAAASQEDSDEMLADPTVNFESRLPRRDGNLIQITNPYKRSI